MLAEIEKLVLMRVSSLLSIDASSTIPTDKAARNNHLAAFSIEKSIRIEMGCYEMYGLHPRGRRVLLLVDPATAKVVPNH
ncbi:PepSY domain-containing protein [Rhodoferax sp. AJA081-3]|uniref:PepSY domain-containing protein n=1 Tax=Rhodoferax sp. AJA081-3 TaxID=2752316 RepID=UPI0035303859